MFTCLSETSVVQPYTGDDQAFRADSKVYVPLQAPMAEATLHKLYPWNQKITEYSELEGPTRIFESNSEVNGPYGDQTHKLGIRSPMF